MGVGEKGDFLTEEPGEKRGRGAGRECERRGGEARGRKARERPRSLSRSPGGSRGTGTPRRSGPRSSRSAAGGGRRGREGGARRGCGEGDYSISGRRIGCIQSQSGCKPGTGLVAWVQGERGGGLGADRKRRGEGLERGHLLQLSPQRLRALPRPPPASSSWQLLSIAPLSGWAPTPIPHSTPLSHASSVQRGTRNLSLSINFVLPVNAAPPLAPTRPSSPFGRKQATGRILFESQPVTNANCVSWGRLSPSHLPRLSGDRFMALKVPRRPLPGHGPSPPPPPHLARKDEMLRQRHQCSFSPRVFILRL